MDVFADYSVGFFGRKCDVTGNLTVMVRDLFRAKAKWRGINVTWLDFKPRPINRPPIKSRGRACLQTASTQAEILQCLPKQHSRRLTGASCWILLLAAMDQSVQKSPGRDDYSLRRHASARPLAQCLGQPVERCP